MEETTAQTDQAPESDEAIRALVTRLARPHSSGGTVIERATLLAEGPDFTAIVAWITAHDGRPESAAAAAGGGLHGDRGRPAPVTGPPLRYILPAGAL
jgi:hypothetical protein